MYNKVEELIAINRARDNIGHNISLDTECCYNIVALSKYKVGIDSGSLSTWSLPSSTEDGTVILACLVQGDDHVSGVWYISWLAGRLLRAHELG